MNTHYRNLKVALLGAGSVGSQVARVLLEHGPILASRIGAKLELVGVGVRNLDSKRDYEIPAQLLTTDLESLTQKADIVVELMGGIEPSKSLILSAINSGADVVTANKALIAAHGPELFAAASQVGAQIFYEAAVGGAIPIIRPLRESLAGDYIERVLGIVNGTTNYILDQMTQEGTSFEDALAAATAAGYAEADPTADIEGQDAASKAAILASLAFHTQIPVDQVYHEGITKVTAADIRNAARAGSVVKLLAICERQEFADGTEAVSAKVYPALIPNNHPLAAVHGANNAVFVQARAAGNLMFYGAGAGGVQTSSAVLGDIVTAARRLVVGGQAVAEAQDADLRVLDFAETETRYQISLQVLDEPGVLARIAGLISNNQVSVETVMQSSGTAASAATLTVGTHRASENNLQATVAALAASADVVEVSSIIRIEGVE
ncbi:MAG: homoserine dehydrogenase [Microbacteriaceae bacterium]